MPQVRVGALVLVGLVAVAPARADDAVSLAAAPPVVLKTVPPAGTADVDPGLTEITVTYDKPMTDGSWSWSTWGTDTFPEMTGKPHYQADKRTCVLPVKLQPGHTYATWLNSDNFTNFKDADGHPAVPYLLVFKTRDAAPAATQPAERVDAGRPARGLGRPGVPPPPGRDANRSVTVSAVARPGAVPVAVGAGRS